LRRLIADPNCPIIQGVNGTINDALEIVTEYNRGELDK
jgi:hypothetical protein